MILPYSYKLYDDNGELQRTQFANLDNPLAILEGTHMDANRYRYYGTVYGEYFIWEDLSLKLNVGGDINNEGKRSYIDRTTITGNALGGIATVYSTDHSNYLIEGTINYNKQIDKHRINVVLGSTTQKFIKESSSIQGNNFSSDATRAFNMGLAEKSSLVIGSSKASNSLLSYLGRLNYVFSEKYTLTGTYRIDGSSRFGEENRFGFFPSLSLGWLMDREEFFSPLLENGFLSMLKLRGSWGQTGNQEIGNNQSLITFNSGRKLVLNDQFVNTLKPSRIANPDLKWETTEQINGGLDFGFIGNRITGSIDWFWKNTYDMLISLPIPSSTGYSSKLVNIGRMVNSGIEVGISSYNADSETFFWRTDFNFSTLNNQVKELGPENDRILLGMTPGSSNNSAIITIGSPIKSFYGYKINGVWQSDEAELAAKYGNEPGQFKFEDVNNDGVVNSQDRVILGNSIPNFTFGLGNTWRLKSWELHVFLDGVYGVKALNGNLFETYFPYVTTVRVNKFAQPLLNRWTIDNPSNSEPSFVHMDTQKAFSVNNKTVVNASYTKLRTVRLGYDVPQKLFRGLQLYISGQNLLTISDYEGFDPALNPNGDANLRIDWNGYPSSRTFLFGINIIF